MRPIPTCGAIIAKEGKILLTKRNVDPYRDFWVMPGGKVEWRETLKEAIKREIKEEIGLDFKPVPFNYYEEIISEINWHAISFFFTGKHSGEIKINKEVKEFAWFSEKEIVKIKLAFLNKKVLEDYFKNV